MIIHLKNKISDDEIKRLYKIWFSKQDEIGHTDHLRYRVSAIEIQKYLNELNLTYSFPLSYYRNCLLQTIDETYNGSMRKREFHKHINEWTYVLYLNDNYKGGEIYFQDGTIIKPEKGDVVIFSGEEGHAINTPYDFTEEYYYDGNSKHKIDKRFTIVGFCNTDIINPHVQKNIL